MMTVTLVLPFPAPLALGKVVEVEREDASHGRPVLRDVDTGVRYEVGAALMDLLPSGQARVIACTIRGEGGGSASTELVLLPFGEPVGASPGGAAVALSGAEQAAASAGAQAALWGGGDRPPREEPERFW
ncbi:hypothetical protein J2Y69_002383 [Microbacterium resistens]|uniref:Primosomal protein N' 3' DNA-binding domain-containing protein n=1 Tax=Microbacterium resistens TaxID=156977 RepID=A0ABU1SDT2_9MICO|nr:hypothetical protein [Microbacterium resistens]MDR6867775.1 hypothetical protein [Microbacterium resistens]